jgi:N-methylhydantoinase A
MYRIGVDVGGTFTDFTLLNESNGSILFYKTPSTPSDPSEAIEVGLTEMLALYSLGAADVTYLGHGTTVATNIVIERRGARTGLLTTKGFRDVLELGPSGTAFDLRLPRAEAATARAPRPSSGGRRAGRPRRGRPHAPRRSLASRGG